MRYTAFGETRYTAGTTPTSFRYTGQRQAEAGLYFYVARMYDPTLGRFLSADTYIPGAGNPQAYDRYAYSNNNPVIFIDPSGHKACELECSGDNIDEIEAKYGAAWYGKWDVQEQKANQEKIDRYLLGGVEAALYTVAPPIGLFFAFIRPGGEVNGMDVALAFMPAGVNQLDDITRLLPAPLRKNYPWHHLLPKKFREEFELIGIQNIDKYLVSLPEEVHKTIHRGPLGGAWNDAWGQWLIQNPKATPEDVFKQINVFIYDFGLDGLIKMVK